MDLAMAVADRLPLSLISSHSPQAQLGWQQGMLAGNRRSRHLGETVPRGELGWQIGLAGCQAGWQAAAPGAYGDESVWALEPARCTRWNG